MRRFRLPDWMSPLAVRTIHAGARWVRPLTIGVRAAIIDADDRVFLVRHSYVAGWHLPGGAVEPGETIGEALRREVREEAGLEVEGTPALLGIYFNRGASKRDHVVVYVVRAFVAIAKPTPDWEIVEKGFFRLDGLPADTTPATLARLDEIRAGASIAADW